ncbi:hypothetical protein [Streptomyces cyslabdanicus]|uniref:hypothetical protein n=1 Tax=Streptomyces cyslabdanicus TaxID=1470456 RepID=UPI00404438DE
MTSNNPSRNQSPAPVTPWFARLFRRPSPATTTPAPAAPNRADLTARLARDLQHALEKTDRWKRHANEFATERDGAYRERAQLLAWLAALHPALAVITPAADVTDEDGWHLLYLVAGGWQMSWHIHPRDLPLFKHVTVVEPSDERAQWDGHGTEQKYQRMRNHVRLLALDELAADGSSTPVTPEARSA